MTGKRILHQWHSKDCTVVQSSNNIWCKLKICNQSKHLKTQNLKSNAFHISSSDVAYVGLWMQVTYCWTHKVKSVIPSQLLRTCGLVYTAHKMWLRKNPRRLVWKLLLICFSLTALLCNSYLPKIQQLSRGGLHKDCRIGTNLLTTTSTMRNTNWLQQ